ncbi:hypothetical protein Tco_1141229, partial [Tanacetum coccineum]
IYWYLKISRKPSRKQQYLFPKDGHIPGISVVFQAKACLILLPSSRRASKSSSKISSITSILKQVFLRLGELYYLLPFQDNEIYGKDLRVLRDSFAYSEYDMRLMLAPMSARALHEKALLKVHGIRKLPGSPSFGGTLF